MGALQACVLAKRGYEVHLYEYREGELLCLRSILLSARKTPCKKELLKNLLKLKRCFLANELRKTGFEKSIKRGFFYKFISPFAEHLVQKSVKR